MMHQAPSRAPGWPKAGGPVKAHRAGEDAVAAQSRGAAAAPMHDRRRAGLSCGGVSTRTDTCARPGRRGDDRDGRWLAAHRRIRTRCESPWPCLGGGHRAPVPCDGGSARAGGAPRAGHTRRTRGRAGGRRVPPDATRAGSGVAAVAPRAGRCARDSRARGAPGASGRAGPPAAPGPGSGLPAPAGSPGTSIRARHPSRTRARCTGRGDRMRPGCATPPCRGGSGRRQHVDPGRGGATTWPRPCVGPGRPPAPVSGRPGFPGRGTRTGLAAQHHRPFGHGRAVGPGRGQRRQCPRPTARAPARRPCVGCGLRWAGIGLAAGLEGAGPGAGGGARWRRQRRTRSGRAASLAAPGRPGDAPGPDPGTGLGSPPGGRRGLAGLGPCTGSAGIAGHLDAIAARRRRRCHGTGVDLASARAGRWPGRRRRRCGPDLGGRTSRPGGPVPWHMGRPANARDARAGCAGPGGAGGRGCTGRRARLHEPARAGRALGCPDRAPCRRVSAPDGARVGRSAG